MVQQEIIYKRRMSENLKNKSKEVLNNYLLVNYFNENKMYHQLIDYGVLPYRVDLEPTARCFLKCKYCQVPFWDRKNIPDMNFETFKQIVDKLPYMLDLKLQGQGEPLLNKDYFKMIDYAVKNNILVRFYTNGVLLNRQNCENLVNLGVYEIRLSFDGATAETVEKLREGVRYQDLIDNVKCLLEVRGKKELPLINFWMLASRENFHEIPQLIRLASELGVDGVKIQTKISVKNQGLASQVSNDLVNIRSRDNQDIIEEAIDIAKELDMHLEVQTKIRTKTDPCWWLWNSIFISIDGYVTPCCMIFDPNDMNFGNIFEKDITEILNGEEYNNFRKDILGNKIKDCCSWCYKNTVASA